MNRHRRGPMISPSRSWTTTEIKEPAMRKSRNNQMMEKRDEWILVLVAMVIPVTTVLSMV